MDTPEHPTVALLGGTGAEGRALATRLAAGGVATVLGSRDSGASTAAAAEVARAVAERPGAVPPAGADNRAAAAAAEVAFLCVPYAAQESVLSALRDSLAGKVLVHVVVPLDPAHLGTARVVAAGSAAVEAQQLLGGAVRVVAAFHHLAAARLRDLERPIDSDVLVCGDDPAAKDMVGALARAMGLTAFDAGPLANACVLEGLTAVLLGINRRYKARAAGVRLTGIPRATP